MSLKEAASAWRVRGRRERDRQGLFELDEEAFASGMVLVRVSVSRARGLGAVAAMAAAAAAGTTAAAGGSSSPPDGGQDQLVFGGGGDAGAGSSTEQEQQQASAGQDAGGDGRGGGGRGLGALGGLGLEGAKVSSSMRKFGGRMKGMGVKAVAMARIASQASPAAHLRLGAVSTEEKILRQVRLCACACGYALCLLSGFFLPSVSRL